MMDKWWINPYGWSSICYLCHFHDTRISPPPWAAEGPNGKARDAQQKVKAGQVHLRRCGAMPCDTEMCGTPWLKTPLESHCCKPLEMFGKSHFRFKGENDHNHWTFAQLFSWRSIAEDYSTGTIWHTPRATAQSADGTGCTSIPAVALWGVRRSCSRRIVLASIAWRCAHSVCSPSHEIYHLQFWTWHHMEITIDNVEHIFWSSSSDMKVWSVCFKCVFLKIAIRPSSRFSSSFRPTWSQKRWTTNRAQWEYWRNIPTSVFIDLTRGMCFF